MQRRLIGVRRVSRLLEELGQLPFPPMSTVPLSRCAVCLPFVDREVVDAQLRPATAPGRCPLDQLQALATRPANRLSPLLDSRAGMVQAVILAEILGPPKGLRASDPS